MHGRGYAWQEACVARGHAWPRGGMCCRGHVWQGACVARGTYMAEAHVWQEVWCMAGGMHGKRGHAWQKGACMVGGMHGRGHAWQGVCMAGEMATAAEGSILLECILVLNCGHEKKKYKCQAPVKDCWHLDVLLPFTALEIFAASLLAYLGE